MTKPIIRKSLMALTVLSAIFSAACSSTGKTELSTATEVTQPQLENTVVIEERSQAIPTEAPVTTEILENDEEKMPHMALKPEQATLFFAFDDATVHDKDLDTLREHAEYLLANPQSQLVISGHTDSYGDPAYNRHLGEKRAREVAHKLVELGIAEERLLVVGYADEKPLSTATSQRENRRVELNYSDFTVAHSE